MPDTRTHRPVAVAAAIAAATLSWTACVSVNATEVAPGRSFSPVSNGDVRIFQTEEDVPGYHVEVAILHASGQENWTDQSDMMNKMREKAAELGANGIVVSGIEEPGTGEQIVGALFGTGADREGRALAIRWGELVPDSVSADTAASAESDTAGFARRPLPHVRVGR